VPHPLLALKRFLVGEPIPSAEAHEQRLSKKRALATFSSDPLSSVAYATEEILLVLMLAGTAYLKLSIPISLAIVTLLVIVVVSYRQTIHAYPQGGGAYRVAHENLGEVPGLVAAAALLTDYILTVAVSIAAGVAAITSAFPSLANHNVGLALFAVFVVTVMNLRGIRESSAVFAVPTYLFIFGVLTMLGVGAYKLSVGEFTHLDPPALEATQPFALFLLLRAFSSGCTAMTGVEAVSNGVPVFREPAPKNAARTLVVMVCLLSIMFFGITYLSHYHGIAPAEGETVLSQLARSIYGTTFPYYFVQFATMGILILAANTAYADFPRLSSILARDRYLPRQLMSQGDRLVFSNGVVALGVLSSALIVLFKADTHALIPLYAVGVFLSFTLSQLGMVRHWWKEGKPGWQGHASVNLLGGILTAIVTVVFTVTKFTHGAWIVTLVIPLFISMFLKVKRHYINIGSQLSLVGQDPANFVMPKIKHSVILPISGMHRGILEALRYAQSISNDVRAVYVELDPEASERLQKEWARWAHDVPLIVLKSPYRSILTPILRYVEDVREMEHDDAITLLIPEFVTARWWQSLLHNQTALMMRAALAFRKGIVVTSVRYHLR
jgi:amino acid transporter